MIKFNDRFEFEKDKHQWTLSDWHDTKDKKTGESKRVVNKSFHGSLRQVMRTICDREAGACESLQEIIDLMDTKEWTMLAIAESLLPTK